MDPRRPLVVYLQQRRDINLKYETRISNACCNFKVQTESRDKACMAVLQTMRSSVCANTEAARYLEELFFPASKEDRLESTMPLCAGYRM